MFSKFSSFLKREDVWFAAAVSAAIIVFGALLAGAIGIYLFAPAGLFSERFDLIYKGALIGAGLVTFLTVCWRGLVATRQAEIARRQVEATGESNLAELLQKGAELISDMTKPAHVSAGIATLHAVATDPNGKFALQAMDLIAEFIGTEGRNTHDNAKVKTAIVALNSAWKLTGRLAGVLLTFIEVEDEDAIWQLVLGAEYVTYRGGRIVGKTIGVDREPSRHPNLTFRSTRFNQCDIDSPLIGPNFVNCKFNACAFENVHVRILRTNTFERCDFSLAIIRGSDPVPDIRSGDNWFHPESTPMRVPDDPTFDWTSVLCSGKPPPKTKTAKSAQGTKIGETD